MGRQSGAGGVTGGRMDEAGVAEEILREISWDPSTPCHEAETLVRRLVDDEAAEPRKTLVLTLASVLSLHHHHNEGAECPFFPEPTVAALDKQALGALATAARSAALPPLVMAQLIDVAWHRRACAYDAVQLAIEAYMRYAAELRDRADWLPVFRCCSRALALSAALRRASPAHERLLDDVAQLVTTAGQEPGAALAKLSGLLIDYGYRRGADLLALAKSQAESAIAGKDFFRARALVETQIAWHKLQRDAEGVRDANVRLAETIELQAEHLASLGEPSLGSSHQADAVQAWRNIEGEAQRARLAHARLQAMQKDIPKKMAQHRTDIDLSDCAMQARERVAGKTLPESIRQLVTMSWPRSVSTLKRHAADRLNRYVFYSLMPRISVNADGRTTHIRQSVMTGGDDSALLDEVRDDCVRLMQIFAMGGVHPAVAEIQFEHGVTARDLVGLVTSSAFVPPRRRASFARGLALGFQGQYSLAAHLLMPQFEHALRVLMQTRGVLVSSLSSANIQQEDDLGKLLGKPEVKAFLGDDEHFELETLLVAHGGANLRNELAHGLFDDNTRDSVLAFFWWKVLRYVLILTELVNISDMPYPTPGVSDELDEANPEESDDEHWSPATSAGTAPDGHEK